MRAIILLGLLLSACPGQEPATPTEVSKTEQIAATPAVAEAVAPADVPPRSYADARTSDVGIFSELDDGVVLRGAEWLDRSAALVIANQHGDGFVFVAGRAVGFAGDATPDIVVERFAGADQDGDDIPDQLDVLIGAKKAALNNAAYGSPYREIGYPGGDVPRDEGVCTDTVIRAVRNAGIDLQQTLYDDIKAARRAFPMVKKINPNIDHRRVKTLLPHFERHWVEQGADPDDVLAPWLPGDVIFMQTMGDARPDHIGIVADVLGGSGAPLIVNNWTDGYATSAMDVARLVPITNRFRLRSELRLPPPHGGLEGLLHRQHLTVPDDSAQVVAVTAHGWNSVGGELRRYERSGAGWKQVGAMVPVTLGANGLAGGRGLHQKVGTDLDKREGDRRAPAGVFELGTAFGRAAAPRSVTWPYRRVTAADRFVDDPSSPHYNSWQVAGESPAWTSAERLDMYDLGVVVEHNMPAEKGAGSAIFLHTWQGGPAPTLGCTAMDAAKLTEVIAWLDPGRRPVLVQVAGQVFGKLEL